MPVFREECIESKVSGEWGVGSGDEGAGEAGEKNYLLGVAESRYEFWM
ncbi:hypothetical protein GXM_06852 [Nostoc sphaeroides CCNUC1]|uniref:Uncharacterized protein n=1 Tax=Nostoc sphaeroides CCNUC1 TaxID=2653204 RepID=A0A5P8W9E2_9NOSO|nr:hypothetical protein GXM_06852 [Nostoc sphaeroides CCNUC1]